MKETLKVYDGTAKSINQIATKYQYSERTLRKMIKEHVDKEKGGSYGK